MRDSLGIDAVAEGNDVVYYILHNSGASIPNSIGVLLSWKDADSSSLALATACL